MSEAIDKALAEIQENLDTKGIEGKRSPTTRRELIAIQAHLVQAQQLERIADALEPIDVSIQNVDVAIQNLQRMRGRIN